MRLDSEALRCSSADSLGAPFLSARDPTKALREHDVPLREGRRPTDGSDADRFIAPTTSR